MGLLVIWVTYQPPDCEGTAKQSPDTETIQCGQQRCVPFQTSLGLLPPPIGCEGAYSNLNVSELKEILSARGLKKSGRKVWVATIVNGCGTSGGKAYVERGVWIQNEPWYRKCYKMSFIACTHSRWITDSGAGWPACPAAGEWWESWGLETRWWHAVTVVMWFCYIQWRMGHTSSVMARMGWGKLPCWTCTYIHKERQLHAA